MFIKDPMYIAATYRATKKTLEICDSKFGQEHHLDTKANAFRHALWNYLLCEKYYAVSRSKDKAIAKSRKITDLHEVLLPNPKCERLMDLHNNKIGRDLFRNKRGVNIVNQLENMLKEAKKLRSTEDINEAEDHLVYLEE